MNARRVDGSTVSGVAPCRETARNQHLRVHAKLRGNLIADTGIAITGVVLLWQALVVTSWGLLFVGLICMYLAALDPARAVWRRSSGRSAPVPPGVQRVPPAAVAVDDRHSLLPGFPCRVRSPEPGTTGETPNLKGNQP